MTFELNDFEAEVLQASHRAPVLVDFWAEWCGPCRILGPTLERLAGEAKGRWSLVKVNTDTHPELASRYGIRGIPDVRLFVDGEPVEGFVGALPEPAIRRWLEENLPSTEDRDFQAAIRAAEGNAEKLEALLVMNPDHHDLRFHLAEAILGTDPERAQALLSRLAPSRAIRPESVLALSTLAEVLGGEQARLLPATALEGLRASDDRMALEALIGALGQGSEASDLLIRRVVLALFQRLGHDHPWVGEFRRRMSEALFR
jgi:putative thioredoxin